MKLFHKPPGTLQVSSSPVGSLKQSASNIQDRN